MPVGKLAAQAGHAYTNTLLKSFLKNPKKSFNYEKPGQIGTKICLKSKNLKDLLEARDKAQSLGINYSLITDSGHILPPHFDGNPIITALGIGPCTKEEAKILTKRFRMM